MYTSSIPTLNVGKVAVVALIDRLESSGFIIRQADPVDRCIKRVYVAKQASDVRRQAAQG